MGKANYFLSTGLYAKLAEARRGIAKLVTAGGGYECVFYKSITEALNAMCVGMCGARRGFNIRDLKAILCVAEHHSAMMPWIACGCKAALEILKLDNDYIPSVRAYLKLVGGTPLVLVLTHSSNVLGCLIPIRLYTNVCVPHCAVSIVDGAQAAPHFAVDVQRLRCTAYLLASHKLYSAAGVGVCVGLCRFLNDIKPVIYGGGGVSGVSLFPPCFSLLASPQKHEAGSAAPFAPVCLREVWRWRRRFCGQNELKLMRYVWTSVQASASIWRNLIIVNRLYPSTRMLSFVLKTVPAATLSFLLNKLFVCVRAGAHCAAPLVSYMKFSSVCRASLGMYNTYKDADALVLALRYVCKLSGTAQL